MTAEVQAQSGKPNCSKPTDYTCSGPAGDTGLDRISCHWDLVVIGAGPAGAVSALLAAREGMKVLLVDKSVFPRSKVCGSCLSTKTLHYLEQAGLGDLPTELKAAKISNIRLSTTGGAISLPLPVGLALSREAFDNAVVTRAIEAGALFLPETAATAGASLGQTREVTLRAAKLPQVQKTIQAACLIVADGINGRALSALESMESQSFRPLVARGSRIGAGAIIKHECTVDGPYQAGTIFMAVHKGGYVGLVRLEDGRLDLAAAFDPAFTRAHGSPQAASRHILQSSGLTYLPAFDQGQWSGTAPLTRYRSKLAARRLFIAGDAASYGEPFTGEGIAWAVASALLVVPKAMAAVDNWHDKLACQWQLEHSRLIGKKQANSRRLGLLLRNELFSSLAIGGILKHAPSLAAPIVDRVCR